MPDRRSLRLLGALLLAAAALPAAAAEDEITWLTLDFPPFFIHQGPDAGRGMADGVLDVLERRMTGWTHRREMVSPTEINLRLMGGQQACTPAFLRTPERERFMLYSIPDLVLPPNGITVRRKDLARFGVEPGATAARPVSLSRLLEDGSLRLGASKGRAYGEAIDALLARHGRAPHVYRRLGDDIYRTLFDLLRRGSVDYILGYPHEARYLARSLGVDGDVVSLPLAENLEPALAHLVCPDTPWGRRVVAEVDAILREERHDDAYRGFVERWLDQEMLPTFREAWDSVMRPAAPVPVATE